MAIVEPGVAAAAATAAGLLAVWSTIRLLIVRGSEVEDEAAGLRVGRRRRAGGVAGTEETSGLGFRRLENRRQKAGKCIVGRTELVLVRYQVVVHSGHGSQPERDLHIRQKVEHAHTGGILLGDENSAEE